MSGIWRLSIPRSENRWRASRIIIGDRSRRALILSASRRSSVKHARVMRAWEIFRNTERVRGARQRADTTGLSGWVCHRVCTTGRRNKILLKLIRTLGHVCKESRRRRGRRDSPPKVDRSVWAQYFNESSGILTHFRLPATFPPCNVVPTVLLPFRYIYCNVVSPFPFHQDCRLFGKWSTNWRIVFLFEGIRKF